MKLQTDVRSACRQQGEAQRRTHLSPSNQVLAPRPRFLPAMAPTHMSVSSIAPKLKLEKNRGQPLSLVATDGIRRSHLAAESAQERPPQVKATSAGTASHGNW